MDKIDEEGFAEVRPICPFCSHPWSEYMIRVMDVHSEQGCPSCGYGAKTTVDLLIECENCKKIIYRKEKTV